MIALLIFVGIVIFAIFVVLFGLWFEMKADEVPEEDEHALYGSDSRWAKKP